MIVVCAAVDSPPVSRAIGTVEAVLDKARTMALQAVGEQMASGSNPEVSVRHHAAGAKPTVKATRR